MVTDFSFFNIVIYIINSITWLEEHNLHLSLKLEQVYFPTISWVKEVFVRNAKTWIVFNFDDLHGVQNMSNLLIQCVPCYMNT